MSCEPRSLADVRRCLRAGIRRRHRPVRARRPGSAGWPSGGQQNRTGANGEVPRPADTCRRMWRAPAGGAAGAGAVEAAVGDDRAVAGKAELAAVGVAGEDQVVAVGGEGVEDAGLGGVGQAELERRRPRRAGRRRGRSGRCRMCGSSTPATAIVTPATSIVRRVCVASCQPRSISAARRSRHGSVAAVHVLLPGREQVAGGVLERRAEVVVAAADEDARAATGAGPARRGRRARRGRGRGCRRCRRRDPAPAPRAGDPALLERWPGVMCRSDRCST